MITCMFFEVKHDSLAATYVVVFMYNVAITCLIKQQQNKLEFGNFSNCKMYSSSHFFTLFACYANLESLYCIYEYFLKHKKRWCYLCKLEILSSSHGSSRAATNAFQEIKVVKFADPLYRVGYIGCKYLCKKFKERIFL